MSVNHFSSASKTRRSSRATLETTELTSIITLFFQRDWVADKKKPSVEGPRLVIFFILMNPTRIFLLRSRSENQYKSLRRSHCWLPGHLSLISWTQSGKRKKTERGGWTKKRNSTWRPWFPSSPCSCVWRSRSPGYGPSWAAGPVPCWPCTSPCPPWGPAWCASRRDSACASPSWLRSRRRASPSASAPFLRHSKPDRFIGLSSVFLFEKKAFTNTSRGKRTPGSLFPGGGFARLAPIKRNFHTHHTIVTSSWIKLAL